MKTNVGHFDSLLRMSLGVALVLFAALSSFEWRWWALIGLVPLITGALRFCPIYSALHITSTGGSAGSSHSQS